MIDGFMRFMETSDDVVGPINLGNPYELTVKDLADLVVAKTKSRSVLSYRDLPVDDPRQRCPDISRAKRELDWQPQVDLDSGLDLTIAYFENELQRVSA